MSLPCRVGIPDLRAPLGTRARGRAHWANLPISSITSLLTDPAGTIQNAALISAKALQAIRFQTKQSGSMNQNFFWSVLLTDEFPEGGKVTLSLSCCWGFFFLFFSYLVVYSPFTPSCIKPGHSESALGRRQSISTALDLQQTERGSRLPRRRKSLQSPLFSRYPASELNGSLVFSLQSHKIQRRIWPWWLASKQTMW